MQKGRQVKKYLLTLSFGNEEYIIMKATGKIFLSVVIIRALTTCGFSSSGSLLLNAVCKCMGTQPSALHNHCFPPKFHHLKN